MGTGEGVADVANLAGSMSKDLYRDTGLMRQGSDYSGASGGGAPRRGGRRRERVRLQETAPHSADEGDPDQGCQSSNPGSNLNVAFSLVRKVSARVSNVGNKSKGKKFVKFCVLLKRRLKWFLKVNQHFINETYLKHFYIWYSDFSLNVSRKKKTLLNLTEWQLMRYPQIGY
jgi:hypothetical protein